MKKISAPEKVFMSVRVSNWLDRPVYNTRLKAGRWEVRLNAVDPVFVDLGELLGGVHER